MKNTLGLFVVGLTALASSISAEVSDNPELTQNYKQACANYSDINEHVPVLYSLTKECSSVVEIGLRAMVSTWGLLQGLSENSSGYRSYIGIDIAFPPSNTLNLAETLAKKSGIAFQFWHANDMHVQIPPVDLLFIDSLHTYCHLTYELEKFASKVQKYIAMHDTSAPWGNQNEPYGGNYSEYPASIDKTKQGLWPAVEDFLKTHPDWSLLERRTNNHGLTILKRVN